MRREDAAAHLHLEEAAPEQEPGTDPQQKHTHTHMNIDGTDDRY